MQWNHRRYQVNSLYFTFPPLQHNSRCISLPFSLFSFSLSCSHPVRCNRICIPFHIGYNWSQAQTTWKSTAWNSFKNGIISIPFFYLQFHFIASFRWNFYLIEWIGCIDSSRSLVFPLSICENSTQARTSIITFVALPSTHESIKYSWMHSMDIWLWFQFQRRLIGFYLHSQCEVIFYWEFDHFHTACPLHTLQLTAHFMQMLNSDSHI